MENTTVQMVALFLQTSVQMGTPILFATLGAILGEKVGHLNLGVEGMMLMGAVIGFQVGFSSGDPALTLLAAGSAGALGALIYAFVTVTLRANQIVTGLALTIFGTGFSSFVGQKLAAETLSDSLVKSFAPMEIPILKDIPILGKMFFSQSLYVWLAFILAFVVYFFIKCTRYGLNLRVVGENPAAACGFIQVYKHFAWRSHVRYRRGLYLRCIYWPLARRDHSRGWLDCRSIGYFCYLASFKSHFRRLFLRYAKDHWF